MSSYYLGTTLGEENITLFGENTDNYVHILPTNNYTDHTVKCQSQDPLKGVGFVSTNATSQMTPDVKPPLASWRRIISPSGVMKEGVLT